ncbi:peptide-methionine (S)-S-oxide reductase [Vibrio salilacus]|uniref:peptide-methionine (S)-S-oxide reductase n=1 Tax=Vibrio salilacus TaxID=1323749 RepID=UPI000C2AEE4E|nr:peptide-methionine (S)-S-oxide reductase [Vibrio salilacus]
MQQEVYFAGGCLWGVQEFFKHLPGIVNTEAGRANGTSNSTQAEYDGYAECVKTIFNSDVISLEQLIDHLFEIIDPYSVNQQGQDIGEKYRTGIYSHNQHHIAKAKAHILDRPDADKITVEVLALTNYVKSDDEHQDRLTRFPNDYCHIPIDLLHKYRSN